MSEIAQDGVLYTSVPFSSVKNPTQLVTSVKDMVGKKFFSISSGPFLASSRSEVNPEDAGSQGIIASCEDGCFVIHTKYLEKSRDLSDNVSIGPDGNIIVEKELTMTSSLITDDASKMKQTSSGKEFSIGIGHSDNNLYSWGKGMHGQLGQGTAKTIIEKPKQIPIFDNKDKLDGFVAVAVGEDFSIALDKKGSLYSWGENFDRQLGIYTKSRENMDKNLLLKNSMIEDVVFAPRLLPFSSKNPIFKIACGNRFAVALPKNGGAFTWGAGECGQLGTGRCTNREIPTEVSLGDDKKFKVLDVACGSGHVVAILEDGSLCGWGLNKSGQLGLGDTATRFAAVKSTGYKFSKIFAHGNSSAAIDPDGQLYTWGSRAYNRLLHPAPETSAGANDRKAPTCEFAPKKVQLPEFNNVKISSFAFCKYSSGVLIYSTAFKISPTRGPKRSFTKLEIHGCGFWSSPTIIVKFSSKIPSIYNPPRSCTGVLAATGVISCKPPKFVETGVYLVTVSLDGVNFLPQSFELNIYKEATVQKQLPAILNQNLLASSTLTLTISGPVTEAGNIDFGGGIESKDEEQFDIRLLFFRSEFDSGRHHKEEGVVQSSSFSRSKVVFEVAVKGRLEKLPRPHFQQEQAMESRDHSEPLLDVIMDHHTDSEKPKVEVVHTVNLVVDVGSVLKDDKLAALVKALSSSSLPPVFEMKSVVSLNGQDFCAVNNESSVCSLVHNFHPIAVLPCCLSAPRLSKTLADYNEILRREDNDELDAVRNTLEEACRLKVTGKGFIPTVKLPKGILVEGQIFPVLSEEALSAFSTLQKNSLNNLIVPVNCDSFESLSLTLTPDVLSYLLDLLSADTIEVKIRFRMFDKTAENGSNESPKVEYLSEHEVNFFLYQDFLCGIAPFAAKRESASTSLKLGIATAGSTGLTGFPFKSADSVITMHIPHLRSAEHGGDEAEQEVISIPLSNDNLSFNPWSENGTSSQEAPEDPGKEIVPSKQSFIVHFPMQSLEVYLAVGRSPSITTAEQGSEIARAADFVYFSLSLDGKTIPSRDKWAKLYLYDDLSNYIVQPLPKGGAVSGTTVGLQLNFDRPLGITATTESGHCIVRLRGKNESEHDFVSLPGSLARHEIAEPKDHKDKSPPKVATKSVVSFVLPDASHMHKLEPVLHGKDKFLFADISLDGGQTFAISETAKVQIK